MIFFKDMWEDVKIILNKEEELNIKIIEKYNSGFTVKEEDVTTFITRDDFVDLWCKMLYYNQIELNLNDKEHFKQKYVYEILKKLPYVTEESGVLRLNK